MKELTLIILGTILILGLCVGGGIWIDSASCESSATQNSVEYRWGVMAGCSYKHPETGIWVPKENYRAIGD